MQANLCDTLITDCSAVLPDYSVLENAAIAIAGNRILEIGGAGDLRGRYRPQTLFPAAGKLAMPGMYDCHTHSVQQLLKGGIVDEPPIVWRRILVPYESRLTDEDRYTAALLYCVQALKCGITMFADAGSIDMGGTVRAVQESGIRAAIARVGRALDPELPANLCDREPMAAVKAMEALYRQHHGDAEGRIHIWFSLSSPMTISRELAMMVAEAAKQYRTGIHIHLGEHPAEVQHCLTRYGMRPPEFLDACGVLGPNLIAAHCIQITDYDIRLMAERGMHAIHCPTANLTTQGVPKLLAERAAGLRIALGNDGAANARQDMFQQAQMLKYVTQAIYGTPVFEPVVLPLREAYEMMTINGARALGVEDELGTLEAGKKADIVLLDVENACLNPTRDLMNTVMMAATCQDVSDVFVDGKLLVRDRRMVYLDEEELLYRGRKQLQEILKRE